MRFDDIDIQAIQDLDHWIKMNVYAIRYSETFLTHEMAELVARSRDYGDTDSRFVNSFQDKMTDALQAIQDAGEEDEPTLKNDALGCLSGEHSLLSTFLKKGSPQISEDDMDMGYLDNYQDALQDIYHQVQGIHADDLDIDAVRHQIRGLDDASHLHTLIFDDGMLDDIADTMEEVDTNEDVKGSILHILQVTKDSAHDMKNI